MDCIYVLENNYHMQYVHKYIKRVFRFFVMFSKRVIVLVGVFSTSGMQCSGWLVFKKSTHKTRAPKIYDRMDRGKPLEIKDVAYIF